MSNFVEFNAVMVHFGPQQKKKERKVGSVRESHANSRWKGVKTGRLESRREGHNQKKTWEGYAFLPFVTFIFFPHFPPSVGLGGG